MLERWCGVTMVVMTTPKRGRPKKPKTVPIQIRVDPALAAALERLADQNHHARTQEIVLLLEEKLKEEGLWPPKSPGVK